MSISRRDFRRLKEKTYTYVKFNAPLTHNLLLTKGQGVATFTRTTTATVADFEGLLKTAKAGEARFEGARRVENLIPATGTGSASLAVATAKTMTLTAGDYVFSMGIGTGTATFSGTGGATGTLTANATNRTSVLKTITDGTFIVTGSVATLVDLQVENVTGQTNQNPSEYVSNGVPVGLGSELVTNGAFDTDIAGWTQVSFYLGSIAWESGKLKTINSANASRGLATFPIPTVIGNSYTVTIGSRSSVGGVAYYRISSHNVSWSGDLLNGEATTTPLTFKATSNISYIQCGDGSSTANATCLFDDITIKETVYHGAGVDGVKYFTTQNGNTVSSNVVTEATGAAIPEATLKGVRIEVASTNLFLQSATLATQSVTTTATTYTVSFTGTGTVVLSGTYIGTLVGTGANDRVSLSFTATAGTLTATVSGSCTNGQLEAQPMSTSYIHTTTASATRNADVLTFPNAGNVLNTQGTVLMEATPAFDMPSGTLAGYGWNPLIDFGINGGTIAHYLSKILRKDGTTDVISPAWTPLKNNTYKIGSRYGSAGQRNWLDGTAGTNTAFDGSINSGTTMTIGGLGGNPMYKWGGTIKNVKIYKKALSDAKINTLTS